MATYNQDPHLASIEDYLWSSDQFVLDALDAFPDLGIAEAVEAMARAVLDEQGGWEDEL